MLAVYYRNRFAALFVTLLLALAAGPMLESVTPLYNPLEWLLALSLLAAIASVVLEGFRRVPIAVGVAFVVVRLLRAVFDAPGLLPISEGLWVVGAVLALVVAARHAFGRGGVDHERIFAALDAYLLAGFLFGVAYWTLHRMDAASFAGAPAAAMSLSTSMYFSFVTIATLGYGDIVPVTAPARGLAVVEAISGQMYLAVLVARLVSLYSQQSR
jgi:ion channel